MSQAGTQPYKPPSSRTIRERQNSDEALRLLVAQRKLYTMAKRWLALRWIGMLIIAIAAPPIAIFWPQFAVVAGAIAGVWIFVGRSILISLQRKQINRAAAVQEQFDFSVFGMSDSVQRSELPSPEEIFLLTGSDMEVRKTVTKERLRNWYAVAEEQSGKITVALCQRANASYSDRLLRTTSMIWLCVALAWMVGLLMIGLLVGLPLSVFVLGIAFPLLPAFLDVYEYWRGIRRAATDRKDLVETIEDKLQDGAKTLESEDLLVWQETLYGLRRSTPQVPDVIYRLKWKRNEQAMISATELLSRKIARDKKSH